MDNWIYYVITFTATKAVAVMRTRARQWPDGKSRSFVQIMDDSGAWVATENVDEHTAKRITAFHGSLFGRG